LVIAAGRRRRAHETDPDFYPQLRVAWRLVKESYRITHNVRLRTRPRMILLAGAEQHLTAREIALPSTLGRERASLLLASALGKMLSIFVKEAFSMGSRSAE